MKKFHRAAIALLTLVVAHLFVPTVAAHPLGNFTINHYAGLHVSREAILIDYVLDMAEIPAFQEIAKFDANGNGQPDGEESARYHPAQCEAIRSQLDLRFDGRPLVLRLDASIVEFPPGAGGLPTLRLTCGFSAPLALAQGKAQVDFADRAYAERLGWREIVVTTDEVTLRGDFASTSLSQRLTAYPQDLLSNPLNQRQITFEIAPTLAPEQTTSPRAAQSGVPFISNRNDAFTQLITLENLTLPAILLALAVSFIWGAMHALTPGHGKTIVGAYLVGSRGTARHALYLGLTTTVTHTAGVFALGLATFFAARFIVPEQLFPWLSFASGVLVAGIGLNLFANRLRGARLFPSPKSAHHREHDHIHEHDHPHHDHPHDCGHDDHAHAHLPTGADGSAATWRSILALGISGGILPCPSALIVLLSAIALGRIGFGLVLVLAFSAGLAGVLTGIGLLFVYAGRLFQLAPKQGRLLRLLPAASALFITLAGLGITAQALAQIGVIRL